MKILVVDDSRAMRMIVKRTLRQAGFNNVDVSEADNGKTALQQIDTDPPALILCDWNMPEMNGIELLRDLRGRVDSGDVVLVKGSLSMGLGRIVDAMRKMGHPDPQYDE